MESRSRFVVAYFGFSIMCVSKPQTETTCILQSCHHCGIDTTNAIGKRDKRETRV